jgi:3-hydroxybutyryl-CoA dehydratase
MEIKVGDRASYERSFTVRDVELFAELSGDKGEHHMKPDSRGRVMLHGLLTATVPTKLGGDINYIAREITYEFLRPVFAGETVRADSVVTSVEPAQDHLKVGMDFVCYNPSGKEVLRGKTRGVIRTKP